MPRRNQRDGSLVPLNIRPADIPMPPTPKSREQRQRDRERRENERWERERLERKRQRTEGIDWDTCLVPFCDLTPPSGLPKDLDIRLPLCGGHEAMVWRTVQRYHGRHDIYEATVKLDQEQRIRDEADKKRRLANQQGDLYYLRLNGLIKVGWTRDLYDRLRAYGPDVEVLCHYKGSRHDETTLHRNLRPFLARGREWYEDCPAMRDIIAREVERHGEPHVAASWTIPTEAPIRPRKGSRSKPTGLSI